MDSFNLPARKPAVKTSISKSGAGRIRPAGSKSARLEARLEAEGQERLFDEHGEPTLGVLASDPPEIDEINPERRKQAQPEELIITDEDIPF